MHVTSKVWLTVKGIFRQTTKLPTAHSDQLQTVKQQTEDGEEENSLSELPDELLRVISILAKNQHDERGRGTGSLNVFRLLSKAHKRAVDTYASSLAYREYDGLEVLPVPLLSRCVSLESIILWSELRTLEGFSHCRGLKKIIIASQGSLITTLDPLSSLHCLEVLRISPASSISDLNPLSSCTRLKRLSLPQLAAKDVTEVDISMLCKLTRLDDCEFGPMKESYLRDLSPLSHCTQLKRLDITGGGTMCLTPLSSLSGVEELHISNYVSLAPLSSLNRLGRLYISSKQIQSSYWKEIEELQSLIPCLKVTYG